MFVNKSISNKYIIFVKISNIQINLTVKLYFSNFLALIISIFVNNI